MHDNETLDLILELADLERPLWPAAIDELRHSGVPLAIGDDDGGDDGGDDDAGNQGGDDDDTDDSEDGADDDDDDDDSELARARKSAAKAHAEVKRLKAEKDAEKADALKKAGKFEDLYNDVKEKYEALLEKVEGDAKRNLIVAALTGLKAHNPVTAARSIDLDEIEDADDAARAAKALKKSDPYLFDKAPTRQKRAAGGSSDDDDAGDDDGDKNKNKPQLSRLRKGLQQSERNRKAAAG